MNSREKNVKAMEKYIVEISEKMTDEKKKVFYSSVTRYLKRYLKSLETQVRYFEHPSYDYFREVSEFYRGQLIGTVNIFYDLGEMSYDDKSLFLGIISDIKYSVN